LSFASPTEVPLDVLPLMLLQSESRPLPPEPTPKPTKPTAKTSARKTNIHFA
jgi:hypothetical protein